MASSRLLPNERLYDLSLRGLMVIVFAALLVCVGFLLQRWLQPVPADSSLVPLVQLDLKPAVDVRAQPETNPPPQVLLMPGQIFRCAVDGRMSFTDRPCAPGATVTTAPAQALR